MSRQMVSFWIEEGEVELLKEKYKSDNQSEAIRLAIMKSLAKEDLKVLLEKMVYWQNTNTTQTECSQKFATEMA